ncbi:O-fucosyltransferase family protein [Perilla frutescens var. hirtella]|nr:O-fucosyltransferase family protein [Perilla frutescens var. hirtella]
MFLQICDVVVVARLLNATLVIPEIQSTTSSKGISTEFKSFAYLYSEDQFMTALVKDIRVVKTLPKDLKGARRKKEIPSFKVPNISIFIMFYRY